MKVISKNYHPQSWAQLDHTVQERFRHVELLLRNALRGQQPTYDELENFIYKPSAKIKVRQAVAIAVEKRTQHSYSMTHEIACFQKALREGTYWTGQTLYESASAVRTHLFGKIEPLRKFNMTISYHSEWMSISPPAPGDLIFSTLDNFRAEPALFGAINIYLILLTSHPYSDGNGRTSRLMFNLHLAAAFSFDTHYIPLAELTRATAGVYEEFIANACLHGNFRQLIWLMLALLEAYVQHLASPSKVRSTSDFERIVRLVTSNLDDKAARGINEMPPFPLSVQGLAHLESGNEINREFLDAALGIANELLPYGVIEFAVTGLADISPVVAPVSSDCKLTQAAIEN
jgi:hypothetical protein